MIKKIISYFNKNNINEYCNIAPQDEEIAVYFAGNKKQLYQIEQWLNVFEEFNKQKKVAFIFKNRRVFEYFYEKKDFNFNIYFINTLKRLVDFFNESSIREIFYVNNSFRNFHSLINNKAVHIHINHGESEKISTFSNQVKSYDYVYIVGDAAYNKYMLNLVNIDKNKFIKVGRPQIEYIKPVEIETYGKKVILYAPTWEGGFDEMNYSSIMKYGEKIIDTLIEEGYFILYKPHPFTGSRNKEYKKINEKIINKLKNYEYAKVFLDENILNLYPKVDLAIFDNSATIIDFLIFDRPFLLTEMFDDSSTRGIIPVIKYAGENLNDKNIENLAKIVKNNIENDEFKEIRNKIKKYYLGDFDYFNKESTKTFIKTSLDLLEKQKELLKDLGEKQEEFNNTIIRKIKDEY